MRHRSMAVERCGRTDFPVDMCIYPDHGGARPASPKKEQVHPAPQYDGPRPPKDAILISKTGTAHWFGCDHVPDYEFLVPPKYGWIENRGVWRRIGNHKLEATGGNLAGLAQRRGLDCDS